MIFYSLLILTAVFVIVPFGKSQFPDLVDADLLFLEVIRDQFSPLFRGLAVAAVMAAVMSTTDALLLACSSAIAHDIVGAALGKPPSDKTVARLNIIVVWTVGLIAMFLAYSPPALITQLYSSAIGVLSASLFVPVVAGLWWKRANRMGGVASMALGAAVYLWVQNIPEAPPLSAILFALPASALAMWACSVFGTPDSESHIEAIGKLHQD